MNEQSYTLIIPENGNLALKVYSFDNNNPFDHVQRLNYYSIIFITGGSGRLKADFSEYSFGSNRAFFFSPYQPFMFLPDEGMSGTVLYFYPEFFCIYRHQKEVSCGLLFNTVYQPPFIEITSNEAGGFNDVTNQIKTEIINPGIGQYELLVSYLKILLINASRIKLKQNETIHHNTRSLEEPLMIQKLKDVIEEHYRSRLSAGDYAALLHTSIKTLGKTTKSYFNKTLTNLVSERIVIEAKRELYLTSKTVKEIAYELGFDDEYYFSRFFKTNTDVSPQVYRQTVGAGKATA